GELAVDGYTQIGVERKRGRPAGFSVIDMEGRIEITDPVSFLAKLAQGFGSAKAFGNGLMLIRRA
ncbi:MAG: type I-E CRISPR-associated protein Cas6/Cse3/CasE, partial [Hyphomicrobium sp.]